ncbi:MAG: TRAP transporter large permease subunit [Alphaproteobacteria bacterium]|nr:TRAP transporter large permease subunit [Alphaproteobacteria bacterium]
MLGALTTGDWLSVLLFASLCLVLMIGYPIAITLAGTSLLFAVLGHLCGTFDLAILQALPSRYLGTMQGEVLVAVPLFIFMGFVLERSGIAEALLTTMGQLFGKLRGGLGISVVLVGGLLAASTGVVGATVVTMGLISLPAMMRAGYDPRLSTGVICASSTLAQIIPPSTVLIFVGDILGAANQSARMEMGDLSPEPVSVGDLFAGALVPGLILVVLYLAFMVGKAVFQPLTCPAVPMDAAERRGLAHRVVVSLLPPLALVVAVLGSILGGVATATESASVGAVGAVVLAGFNRRLDIEMIRSASFNTMITASMIFVIVLGASLFSLVFRGLGGEHMVEQALRAMPGGAFGAMLVVMLVMFVLGFFLDTFEIILIMVPICGPILIKLGLDPVWLGVMIGVNLQTSFLTPPFGFTLFYMRGIAPASITTRQIWEGAAPWVVLQVIGLAIVWLLPQTATALPAYLFRQEAPATEQETAPGKPAAEPGWDAPLDPPAETSN